MTNPTSHLSVLMTPRRPGLASGKDNTLDVLVRVQAPDRPADIAPRARPDLNIALVIDRSGSMSGAPLEEAKKAAAFVVNHLGPRDRCAIAVYDDRATLLVPAVHVVDRGSLHGALRSIHSGGSTDLHMGWLTGAEALAPHASAASISRVILLSDGNANAGETDAAAIAARVKRLAEAGVTTSTLGLGQSFNEELMTEMASAGNGRSYYGDTAEDLMAPFREEFDLLDAIAAHKVSCLLKPVTGVEMEVLNPYGRDAQGRLVLPDIAWGSEAVIAVRLTVPEAMAANATLVELLSASIGFTDLDGRIQGAASAPLVLPVMPAAALAVLQEDETVARRFGEVEAGRLQVLARRAAKQGDWALVKQLLEQVRAVAGGNPWVAAQLAAFEELVRRGDSRRVQKELHFSSDAMARRISSVRERADMSADRAGESFNLRKTRHGKARQPG